jgi:hypothetical protein
MLTASLAPPRRGRSGKGLRTHSDIMCRERK